MGREEEEEGTGMYMNQDGYDMRSEEAGIKCVCARVGVHHMA